MPQFPYEGVSITRRGVRAIRSGGNIIPRYALTPLGKIKAEDGSITGVQGEIIAAIEDDVAGEMTKRELGNHTKMPDSKVGLTLNKLIRIGYVRLATGE